LASKTQSLQETSFLSRDETPSCGGQQSLDKKCHVLLRAVRPIRQEWIPGFAGHDVKMTKGQESNVFWCRFF
jgi:hypothetical protein